MAVGKPAAILPISFDRLQCGIQYLRSDLSTMYVHKEELHNSSAATCFYQIKQLLPQQLATLLNTGVSKKYLASLAELLQFACAAKFTA